MTIREQGLRFRRWAAGARSGRPASLCRGRRRQRCPRRPGAAPRRWRSRASRRELVKSSYQVGVSVQLPGSEGCSHRGHPAGWLALAGSPAGQRSAADQAAAAAVPHRQHTYLALQPTVVYRLNASPAAQQRAQPGHQVNPAAAPECSSSFTHRDLRALASDARYSPLDANVVKPTGPSHRRSGNVPGRYR
jgi:hypothetical protein